VLEGLTITGASDPFGSGFSGARGVYAIGLAPTIRDCIVRDNQGGLGAGIAGDATIERCRIVGNSSMPYGEGGGLWGAPTVIDCVISDNRSGGRGGGVYATGPCTITGTVLDSNVAGNGSDGYSGGAVYGPATLVQCAITRNSAHHYFSGGPPDVIGTAVEGAIALDRCTVADNFVAGSGPVPGDESGALRHVGSVTSSILWGDQVASLAVGSTTAVTWSIVEGGWPGTGNLAADPLFVAPLSGDYTLQGGSPAIDAGDPSAPLDPDGTLADMGAYVYLQAAAFPVLGSGVNPASYTTADVPALGTTWTASLDATLHHPSTALGALVGVLQPGAPLLTPYGELLLNPLAAPVIQAVAAVSGGSAAFALPVPALPDFVGLTVHTQGLAIGAGLELANGIDLLLAH
jgi:predicted outer membrane repeat protein